MFLYSFVFVFFFFKQKTAYEMRISDWSSDVCSSDLYDVNQAFEDVLRTVGTQEALMAACPAARRRKAALPNRAGFRPSRPMSTTSTSSRSEERRVGKEWVSTCRSRW